MKDGGRERWSEVKDEGRERWSEVRMRGGRGGVR